MTGNLAWRLAEWTGRVLLVGAVAFWWGAVVIPQLVSMIFPDVLPWSALPRQLNPNLEGTLANTVSAAALAVVALLALGNTVRSLKVQDTRNRIEIGGWAVLAVTAAYLATDEILDFRGSPILYAWGNIALGEAYKGWFWPILFSPLIGAFVVAIGVFVLKGPSSRTVRFLLAFGVVCWTLAIMHELSYLFLFHGRVDHIEELLEETLEFGGTLLIGTAALVALGIFNWRGRPGVRSTCVVAIIAVIAALGVIAGGLSRAPVVDARASTHIGTFQISLWDNQSLIQELGPPPWPVNRLDLRLATRNPQGRPGIMAWRISSGERILREGRTEIAARGSLDWKRISFPPLVEVQGQPLALQLIAHVGPGAQLRIGATKTNRHEDGRLWVNGDLAWPDQNIEFAAYSEPELTRGKLRAMWHAFLSDWRWPVLVADVAVVMAIIIFIPALLVTAALPRRGLR